MADAATPKLEPTPWGIDFAEPEGTVAERLRKLTAIQARLIEAANAERPDAKRFREFYNPRFHACGHALAVLRKGMPDQGFDDGGMPLPKYDKNALRKTPEYLADLAAVDLAETFKGTAPAAEPPDPYEDFSAPNYTEVDPNSRFTIGNGAATNSKITAYRLTSNEDAYIYKDFGADHFGTLFEHKFIMCQTESQNTPKCGTWMVSNGVDDFSGLWAASTPSLAVVLEWLSLDILFFDVGDQDYDTYDPGVGPPYSIGVIWYCTVSRDGASALLYIRTGSHTGTLQDTLSITPGTDAYRYLYGVFSWNYSWNYYMSYYVQDLDLQEGTTVEPAAVAITMSAPAPTIRQRISPAAVSITLSAPAPTIKQTARPAAVSLTLSVPTPKITPLVVSPAAVALTLSVPAAIPGPVLVSPAALVLTLSVQAPATGTIAAPAPVVLALSVARPATAGGYAVYMGVGGESAIDYDSPVGNVAPGETSIAIAGLGLAAGNLYYLAVRARSDRGVQEANTDRIVCVEIDDAGDLVGPRPNALLAARAEAAAAGKIDLTIVYNARGAAGAATGVQVARVTGGAADWEDLEDTIPLRSAGITRRTRTLEPTYDDGETVRLAARAVTAGGATGDELLVNPVTADAAAPPAVDWIRAVQV